VDRADPSCTGLVGAHPPDPCGATSDVGRVWRVGDVLVAGVLVVAVALQKMRHAAGEDAPGRLGLRLPVPKHPMYATSAAVYDAFSRKPAVPTLVGCPPWRSRCSVTLTGWSKASMANPKSRYTGCRSSVPLGLRHTEFVCGEMAIFVLGEGKTEPRKGWPRSWPLLSTTNPPSWVMPPVMGNAAHGVRSGPALVALPGPEVGRPRAHRVGEAGAHGGVHGRGLAGAVPARGTVPLRRGGAQTAGVNGALSSGPWRRPGGGLVGRRANFY